MMPLSPEYMTLSQVQKMLEANKHCRFQGGCGHDPEIWLTDFWTQKGMYAFCWEHGKKIMDDMIGAAASAKEAVEQFVKGRLGRAKA